MANQVRLNFLIQSSAVAEVGPGSVSNSPGIFKQKCAAFGARISAHRVLAIAVCYDA
jgi:hypothetical protein